LHSTSRLRSLPSAEYNSALREGRGARTWRVREGRGAQTWRRAGFGRGGERCTPGVVRAWAASDGTAPPERRVALNVAASIVAVRGVQLRAPGRARCANMAPRRVRAWAASDARRAWFGRGGERCTAPPERRVALDVTASIVAVRGVQLRAPGRARCANMAPCRVRACAVSDARRAWVGPGRRAMARRPRSVELHSTSRLRSLQSGVQLRAPGRARCANRAPGVVRAWAASDARRAWFGRGRHAAH
jgi:hypothetical protein